MHDEKPLTVIEKKKLRGCEGVIEKSVAGFVAVGNALATIRDRRLYRTDNPKRTFADYCRERWDMGRSIAYGTIDASRITQHLSAIADIIPATESQCRPLLAFSEPDHDDKRVRVIDMEQVGEAWEEVIEQAEEDEDGAPHITAKHVADVVGKRHSEETMNDNGTSIEDVPICERAVAAKTAIIQGCNTTDVPREFGFSSRSQYEAATKVAYSGNQELIDSVNEGRVTIWAGRDMLKSGGDLKEQLNKAKEKAIRKRQKELSANGKPRWEVVYSLLEQTWTDFQGVKNGTPMDSRVVPRVDKKAKDMKRLVRNVRETINNVLDSLEETLDVRTR